MVRDETNTLCSAQRERSIVAERGREGRREVGRGTAQRFSKLFEIEQKKSAPVHHSLCDFGGVFFFLLPIRILTLWLAPQQT